MEKRPRRTPAEKARAQYTNYAVKEPMELMEFLAANFNLPTIIVGAIVFGGGVSG